MVALWTPAVTVYADRGGLGVAGLLHLTVVVDLGRRLS